MKYGYYFSLSVLIFLSFLTANVFAAEASLVDEHQIHERIKTVAAKMDMEEQAKTNLLELYNNTLNHLNAIKANNKQSNIYANTKKQAAKKIKQLEKKLAKQEAWHEQRKLKTKIEQSDEQILAGIKTVSLSDLELKLNSEIANLAAVNAKNTDSSQILGQEINSPTQIRKQIIDTNRLLEQLQESRKLPPSGSDAEVNQAQRWLLDSHIESLRSEIKMLDLKLLSQPSRLQILKLENEISDYQLKQMKTEVEQLKRQVDLKRRAEMQQTLEMTQTEQSKAKGKHPLIQSLADNNALLSETITQRTTELIELETSDDIVFQETQRIEAEQASTKKKLEIAGLNQILGQVLWEQKKALPESRQYINNLEKREQTVARLGLEHIQYQEELDKVKDREAYLAELLGDTPVATQAIIQDDLISLIKIRKDLLEKLLSIDEKYIKAMSELDFAEKKLIEVAQSYAELLEEHLFWLRSATILKFDNFKEVPQQITFLLNPKHWFRFVQDFSSISKSTFQTIPGLILVVFLLFKRKKIKELMVNIGQKTKKIRTDSLLHTWKSIFYILLLAIPIPMLLWLAGWQLRNTPEVAAFSHAVASGMQLIVYPLFSLTALYYMCLHGGLFEVHFKWSDEVITGLRRETRRLMLTFLPILFITALLISKGEASMNGGLGRLFLLLTLTTFALFFYRLLKPRGGFLSSVAQRNPQSFFARYHTLLFILGMLITVVLMGLTIIGYVYTAVQLTASLIYSVWFAFGLVILHQMSIRWLLLTRRKFALKMAYEKRQAALAQEQEQRSAETEAPEDELMPTIEEPEIDMVSLSEESQKILNVALFLLAVSGYIIIWSEVLPALGIFEKVTLWHHQGVVEGMTQLVPITLSDLALALLILAVTLLGAKRFPAIIEILLLQNNKISSGDRYTITTLINYTIFGIGIFAIFKILGADWNKLQWLFAALSVGIGFGLQEIVANFISGLIILFERPIRVGDYVSVGDNEGIVSRIQIRATTIMTYDRKELLVPNKEFITGQLVNLSLSDPTARIIVAVGVAYGSDIGKARELLLTIAEEHERVLKEPVPRVVFHSFGDNSLNLELRCYIGNVDFRISTISELNEAINDQFNGAGICIAFPQRDVHLDINQPIDVRWHGKQP